MTGKPKDVIADLVQTMILPKLDEDGLAYSGLELALEDDALQQWRQAARESGALHCAYIGHLDDDGQALYRAYELQESARIDYAAGFAILTALDALFGSDAVPEHRLSEA
jgi:hypothetical protein